ncbi:unnamed protein product, partial [Polarella glacialis]
TWLQFKQVQEFLAGQLRRGIGHRHRGRLAFSDVVRTAEAETTSSGSLEGLLARVDNSLLRELRAESE